MTKLSPKEVSLYLLLLPPVCFLATAALQQLRAVEESLLPFLYYHFRARDIPFIMVGIVFIWAYVITASLSVIAQSFGVKNGYDNNEPRAYRSSVKGALARMIAAHQVALENAPAFFAAVIIASANKVPLKYRT
ncbi:5673_t:CDS:2, partial [Acaulospora colombiana]